MINEQIRDKEVRVIGEDGAQLGIDVYKRQIQSSEIDGRGGCAKFGKHAADVCE